MHNIPPVGGSVPRIDVPWRSYFGFHHYLISKLNHSCHWFQSFTEESHRITSMHVLSIFSVQKSCVTKFIAVPIPCWTTSWRFMNLDAAVLYFSRKKTTKASLLKSACQSYNSLVSRSAIIYTNIHVFVETANLNRAHCRKRHFPKNVKTKKEQNGKKQSSGRTLWSAHPPTFIYSSPYLYITLLLACETPRR